MGEKRGESQKQNIKTVSVIPLKKGCKMHNTMTYAKPFELIHFPRWDNLFNVQHSDNEEVQL